MIPRDMPSQHLSRLLELDVEPQRLWQPHELGAILHHQLSIPFQWQHQGLPLAAVVREQEGAALRQLSLGALLHHPATPLGLLEAVKQWARRERSDPASLLPAEVSSVVYYASIAAALLRHGQRITRLADAELRSGLQWVLDQQWVDPALRELVEDAARKLAANRGSDLDANAGGRHV